VKSIPGGLKLGRMALKY